VYCTIPELFQTKIVWSVSSEEFPACAPGVPLMCPWFRVCRLGVRSSWRAVQVRVLLKLPAHVRPRARLAAPHAHREERKVPAGRSTVGIRPIGTPGGTVLIADEKEKVDSLQPLLGRLPWDVVAGPTLVRDSDGGVGRATSCSCSQAVPGRGGVRKLRWDGFLVKGT